MPALTTYTPYETLVFFQNVAELGADESSLQEISTTLNTNQLIRDSIDYDASKLAPDALQSFYDKIVDEHKNDSASKVNGDTLPNGKGLVKKEVTSPSNSHPDHEQFIQDFADKLYAQFRDQTIRELRQQEKEYGDLQIEIAKLATSAEDELVEKTSAVKESGEQSAPSIVQAAATDAASVQLQTELSAAEGDTKPVPDQVHSTTVQAASSQPDNVQPSSGPLQRAVTPRSASGTPGPRPMQSAPVPQSSQHSSPSSFSRTLPLPSPQRSNYTAIAPPHNYPHHPQNQIQPHMLPPIHNLQRVPSNDGYSTISRPSSQGRGSPMPHYSPSPYPHYPPYQQPPHGWHGNVPPQYSQPVHPSQQYPPAHNVYSQIQTPLQPTYPGYPNTAPVLYPAQQQWRPQHAVPYHQYPASANTTPIQRPQPQAPFIRSSSSTPWKSRSTPLGHRPRSPSRLDREVSPLSDAESPPPESPKRQSRPIKKAVPLAASTSETNQSRSQSVFSNVSEAHDPPKRKVGRPPKIKAEVPATPMPVVSDAEQTQRSSGRRGRPRASTTSANVSEQIKPATVLKRKREGPSSSPVPRNRSMSSAQLPTANDRLLASQSDNNHVVVSRTFGKTTQLLLNEITSHKLAGIFAKPLSERDAPGYKSLIHRPQDLKSIKAAITKGSKAAIAAIDELEPHSTINAHESDDINMLTPSTSAEASSMAGPIGNGFYLVRANEDLVPPRGIVNSSQLETELVRMFANAVMFNPLPNSERGFGRALRLRKRGGALLSHGARKRTEGDLEDGEASQTIRETSESVTTATATSDSPPSDTALEDGGIISDAREMFEDVEKLVFRWKELEGEKIPGMATGQQQQHHTERHASASASSAAGDDAADPDGTPNANGTMRKRRRIGDH